jgi:23S rRNA (guanosine2251-2'-O)-methyltransferase
MQHNKPPRQHLKRRAFDNLVIGRQPVLELLQSDKEVDSVYVQGGTQGDILVEIRKAAILREIPLKTVPVEKLNRLTGGNHQGVVAFTAQVEYVHIEDLLPTL